MPRRMSTALCIDLPTRLLMLQYLVNSPGYHLPIKECKLVRMLFLDQQNAHISLDC